MQRQIDVLILDHFVVGHDHENEASCAGLQNVKALHRRGIGGGSHGNGGQIGHFGDHLAHLRDDLVNLLQLQLHSLIEALGFIHRQAVVLHQLIHIQTVAGRGGDAACRGVGLLQQTHLGQIRHLVADGSGGASHAGHGGQHLGANRLSGLDIIVHDGAEDLLFSFRQLHLGITFLV